MELLLKKISCFILLIIINIIGINIYAQNMLVVKQIGKVKNVKYFVGSPISFSYFDRGGEVQRASGIINVINEETIIINYEEEYEIADIKTIYVPRKLLRVAEEVAVIAGAGYLALTGINNLILSNDNAVSPASLITAGSAIGLGLATIPLNTKKYRLDKSDKFIWEVFVP